MYELNANSVDSDQTPHVAASDLSLHCVPMSLLWDARLKWDKPRLVVQEQTGIYAFAVYIL